MSGLLLLSVSGDQVETARYGSCQVACGLRRGWYGAIGAHTSRCLLWRMLGRIYIEEVSAVVETVLSNCAGLGFAGLL